MKKSRLLTLLFCMLTYLFLVGAAFAQPQAICVPWKSSNQAIPHPTYSGAETTLKGIARGGATQFYWDFGDGGSTSWVPITNPYNLGVKHTYSGTDGQLFIATLHVKDGSDNEAQDTYPVEIFYSVDLSVPAELDVRINMATDEGLWYLHTNMIRATYLTGSPGYGQPYGYWSVGYPVAAVGTAVDAFQLHGSKVNGDYNSDPYVETVERALNYLLVNTYSFAIGPQTAGEPDTNGNGIGLVANQSSSLTDHRQTYIGGICMTALASSGAPNRIASVGGTNIHGRTYAEIVQDMVDFFAWGQVDSGAGRGGWRYWANFSDSDMSTAQWPPLGMMAAEENMGATVPQFVRDELLIYLNASQYLGLNSDHGAFSYYPNDNLWANITKAAAGIICHEFLGTPLTDQRVQSAIGFIYRHWGDTGTCWDHTKLHGNSYGMYGVMKAFRIPQPDILRVTEYDYTESAQTANSFDWYYTPSGQVNEGLASYLVRTQQSDGQWDDTVGCNQVNNAFSTGWDLLVMLKGVTTIPPVAEICDCDQLEYNLNQNIPLDGTCSHHPDNRRNIVSYEWDLDDDGVFEAVGENVTIDGGFNETGFYPVTLRVTDDNPEVAQTSSHTCEVFVHPPPHCPHADANGPYIGWVNEPVTLDASGSFDPDNEIVNYEWDMDNDGLFDDATGINPEWTWDAPHTGVIGLKVTDAAGEFDACSDTDYTTIDVGNHEPVAEAGGAYLASADSCIQLDGTNSYDPDAGDVITFAWDLDNDGIFDDSAEPQEELCVGSEIGEVLSVCLKVTDSYGEYDITCTTVEIVPNQPPTADPNGPYLGPLEVCFDGTASSDPDGDSLTYEWDFGDNGNTGTEATPCYSYDVPDIYNVCLTVNDGLEDSEQVCTMAVIYDPSAGFVTGGGWIYSDPGAYFTNPELEGKANFGFVSKYKKGANVPTGNTEFHFHAAGLNFHSNIYDWLVVTGGGYAKFKGVGTINGEGDYKFMLWAGDATGTEGKDTFRIKIWTEDEVTANETVIYDNGFDQAIEGGSIVVHTKKK